MNDSGDVKLSQTDNGGDINVNAGVIAMSGGLETCAYLALFGGNNDGSNWWGNKGEIAERQYVSKTQTLLRSLPITSGNLLQIEDAILSDLAFFIDLKIASTVTVEVTIPAVNTVSITVRINAEGVESEFNFTENWKASIEDSIPDNIGPISVTTPPPPPIVILPGWDLTGTIDPLVSAVFTNEVTLMSGAYMSPDNEQKLFTVDESTGVIYQYTLNVPGNITTRSYDGTSFSVGSEQTAPSAITFADDGFTFYVIGTSPIAFHQYTCPTAFSLIGASYVIGSVFSLVGEESIPTGIWVNAAQTRIYTLGRGNRRLSQFNFGTPGDATTIVFNSRVNVNSIDTSPTGLYLRPDESVAMFTGKTGDYVYQFSLPVLADVLQGVFQKQFGVGVTIPEDVFFNDTGRKMYVVDAATQSIHQYVLPEPQAYRDAVILKAPIAFWELGDLDVSPVVVDTISGYNGTRVGTTTFGVPGLIPSEPNTALLLPGPSADRINLPDIAALRPATNITLEMIFDLDNTGGDNLFKMASGNNGDSSGWGITITGGTRVDFYLATVGGNNANGNPNAFLSASAVVTITGPYLVHCTYDGSIRRIYVNGFEVQSSAKAGAIKYGPVSGLAEAPYIGAHAFNGALTGTGLDGVIQYVALYDRVLTPEEILDNQGARF